MQTTEQLVTGWDTEDLTRFTRWAAGLQHPRLTPRLERLAEAAYAELMDRLTGREN